MSDNNAHAHDFSRPVGTAPKPNTRFLQNIIRSTDNHNAALKQKELGDAAHRLRALTKGRDNGSHIHAQTKNAAYRDEEQEKRNRKRKRGHERYDSRDSHDYASKSSGNKRHSPERDEKYTTRRREEDDKHKHRKRDRLRRGSDRDGHHTSANDNKSGESDYSTDYSNPARSSKRSARKSKRNETRTRNRDSDEEDRRDGQEKQRDSHHDRNEHRPVHQSQSRSRTHKEKRSHSRTRTKQIRTSPRSSYQSELSDSASESRSRRKKSTQTSKQDKCRSPRQEHFPPSKHPRTRKPSTSSKQDLSDDDPLAPFLGPSLPPKPELPKIRGRGATAFTSGTETRFSTSYDPRNDIKPDIASEGEDWDQALEAFRDRQKFRQAGAERLLAAGFSQEEVTRMERGGEKDESDVRWTQKGQAREWDRGKMLDENGDVAVSAEGFGRLV